MRKADYLNKLHSQSLTDESAILDDIRNLVKQSQTDRMERQIKRGSRRKPKANAVTTPYGVYRANDPSEAEIMFNKVVSSSSSSTTVSVNVSVTAAANKRDLCRPTISQSMSNDNLKKSTTASRKAHQVSTETDMLLRRYASELRNTKRVVGESADLLRVKSSLMPHTSTAKQVETFLALDEQVPLTPTKAVKTTTSAPSPLTRSPSCQSVQSLSSTPPAQNPKKSLIQTNVDIDDLDLAVFVPDNDSDQVNPNAQQKLKSVSADRFRKKYPRFCSTLQPFTDETVRRLSPRSDLWIAKFLELCYDEALSAMETPQPHGRTRAYHGLNVGSLDAFPLLVQRVISRYFSVLDIRTTISLQLLYSLEWMMERAEFARFRAAFKAKDTLLFDGGRASIFAKFLSEEYDVDILALFLYCREVSQSILMQRLRDITPARIWIDQQMTADNPVLQSLLQQKINGKIQRSSQADSRAPGKGREALASVDMQKQRQLDTNGDTKREGSFFATAVDEESVSSVQHSKKDNATPERGAHKAGASKSLLPRSPTRINAGKELAAGDSTTSRVQKKGSYVEKLRHFHDSAEKLTPCELPLHWNFVNDASLREAPLVACDRAMVFFLCAALLPEASTMLATTVSASSASDSNATQMAMETKSYLAERVLDIAVIDQLGEGSNQNKRQSMQLVPLYSIFRALCAEWKKLPPEDKITLNEHTASVYESLRSLNSIYDNNCEKLKSVEAKVHDAESELISINATVLRLEKLHKRLEKKWTADVATREEVAELSVVKQDLARAQASKMAAAHNQRELEVQQQQLRKNVELLWGSAMGKVATIRESAKDKLSAQVMNRKQGQQTPMWILFIKQMLQKTIDLNRFRYRNLQLAIKASHQMQKDVEEAKHEKVWTKEEVTQSLSETLARILVRNAINDGKRKVLLRLQLQWQERALMFKYKNHDFLMREQEARRIEKEAKIRALKAQLTKTMSRSTAFSVAGYAISMGCRRAFDALYDPWWMLNIPVDRLVAPSVLHELNQRYARALYRDRWLRLSTSFRALKCNWNGKELSLHQLRACRKRAWSSWLHSLQWARDCRDVVRRLHSAARHFLWRLRYWRFKAEHSLLMDKAIAKDNQLRTSHRLRQYFWHWQRMNWLKTTAARCRFAISERRFLICFYTWRHKYKQIYYKKMKLSAETLRKCIRLQSTIRRFLGYRRVWRMRLNRRLAAAIRLYRARKQYQRVLSRRRSVECDGTAFVQSNHLYHVQRRQLSVWKRCCARRRVARGLLTLLQQSQLSFAWERWRRHADAVTSKLSAKAVVIQSAARMFFVFVFVFKFSRLRRQIIALQSKWRTHRARRQFIHTIFYYRWAKTIQRVTRGWIVRKQLVTRRVQDIHYSALNNNFEKLKYYIQNFPSLMNRLDEQGNSVLHSAAFGAAKRTLKLLLREGIFATEDQRNAFNTAGYSPLHLIITSAATFRDELFGYMIEHGFDEDLLTLYDEKSCLLLAVEYGRVAIANRLLADGHDANIADAQGRTCLQSACQQGDAVLTRALLDNEANASKLGENGTYPIHDCVLGGNVEVLNLLLHHHVDVNARDETYHQTPLMWACQGQDNADMVAQLLAYNADESLTDASTGRTAAHLAAMTNSRRIYQALRVADADFDGTDNDGNTPLHLAAYYGAEDFASNLLQGGCFPSYQNNVGDTPAHVAARYNQLALIKLICEYDTQIGKLNFNHQSPLAVAKFHQSSDVAEFLEKHYRMIEIVDGRNEVGEIWWDKEIDNRVADWEMQLSSAGDRIFVNKWTGEVSSKPPSLALEAVQNAAFNAALPLRRRVVMIKESELEQEAQMEDDAYRSHSQKAQQSSTGRPKKEALTKHQYYREYNEQKQEISLLSVDFRAATIINKFARRKLAYLEKQRVLAHRRRTRALTRFIRKHLPGFMRYRMEFKSRMIVRIQRIWRGYWLRKHFYRVPDGEYFALREYLARRRLRYQLWSVWTLYHRRRRFQRMIEIKRTSLTVAEWAEKIEKARFPVRTVGVFEEYLFPGSSDIYFYRHSITGGCGFTKPRKLIAYDEQEEILRRQIKEHGATLAQIALTVRLQSLWRGYQIRSYYHFLEKAMEISQVAEKRYLENPEKDSNLYNYALHCFTILQDIDRARHIYVESLRRMQWRGPDIAFVLYSYCVFGLVSGDEEYVDILPLIQRARKAEFVRVIEVRNKLDGEITAKTRAMAAITQANAAPVTSEQLLSALNDDETKKANPRGVRQQLQHHLQQTALPQEDEYRYGKVFDLANTGFFRFAANSLHNGLAWMSFAVCRFIVYNDFGSSFDAFMTAFTRDPNNPMIRKAFDIMMTHFHGPDKRVQDEMVKKRMRYHAQKDADIEEQKRILRDRAKLRQLSAIKIQRWLKSCKSRYIFTTFISNVKRYIKRQKKIHSSANTSQANSRATSRPISRQGVDTFKYTGF